VKHSLRLPHPALIALSWANLFLLPEWLNLLAPSNEWSRYEFPTRHWGAVAAVVAVCLALAAGYWLLLHWSRKSTWAQCVLRLTAIALLFFPLNRIRDVLNLPQWVPFLSWGIIRQYIPLPVLAIVLCASAVAIVLFAYRKHSRFILSVDLVLAIFLPFLLVTTCRSIGGYLNGDLNFTIKRGAFHDDSITPEHRVVWIIFDEMDYRLVFEKRPPGLQLPAWDEILKQSISFEKAYSPAHHTTLAIPSVTLGRTIARLQPEGVDNAILHAENNSNTPIYWQSADTIFHRMSALHANSAIVGWFHGYCRLFGSLVQSCDRHSRIRHLYHSAVSDNFTPILSRVFPLRWGQEVHIEAHDRITQRALQVTADPRFQFVYLHLPVPHPPYIYDSKKGKVSRWVGNESENYFGNVQLTDKFLSKLRQSMESNGTWDQSTVILTSDHHWRQSHLYDGTTDFRVPLIVKPAHSTTPTRITSPASTLGIYYFAVEAIQGNKLKPREVAALMESLAVTESH
jgi:hypothetical protein